MPLIQRVFSITKPQEDWLLSRSAQLGISHAELMRRIMDAARGEMGELLLASSKAPAIMAPAQANSLPPTERSGAILDLMRYCSENRIPETRITELLRARMDGGDWRQASAADYRAVLFMLQHSSDPARFYSGEQAGEQPA